MPSRQARPSWTSSQHHYDFGSHRRSTRTLVGKTCRSSSPMPVYLVKESTRLWNTSVVNVRIPSTTQHEARHLRSRRRLDHAFSRHHEPYFKVLREDVFANDNKPRLATSVVSSATLLPAARASRRRSQVNMTKRRKHRQRRSLSISSTLPLFASTSKSSSTFLSFLLLSISNALIDDWVFLILLVGNDFLPIFPRSRFRWCHRHAPQDLEERASGNGRLPYQPR